ncbi:unnamed protein product [Polarella glacialis]|uniref:Uncharacterized protein n=1 Tax=Polarella glacialis TaxID=89957 RepID=A0A813DL00_POLGL|nr:unnamed protein product [Polarella glacialis]
MCGRSREADFYSPMASTYRDPSDTFGLGAHSLFSEMPLHANGLSNGSASAHGGDSRTSFLSPFGDSELSLQEIADKAHQFQQRIDENAEREKANLRAAAEQKHEEVERHAADLARHAAQSIEAYKESQLQMLDRQKAQRQAALRQQAEQAKRLIDQQAAQAIAAIEVRNGQLELQHQTELDPRAAGQGRLPGFTHAYPGYPHYPGGPRASGGCGVGGPPRPSQGRSFADMLPA